MADAPSVTKETVSLTCVCGEEVRFEPQLLGRIIACPHCGRYLRPALQFFLADKDLAPNLTAQCMCGHFIVEGTNTVGKRARCKVCKNHLILPRPVVKTDVERLVRVPRKVLESQLRRGKEARRRAEGEMTKLESAGHKGRISLRPGEHICPNTACGALLPMRANVCAKCGTNRLTGVRYEGPGPDGDPLGDWHQP
jgi:hypothetical protein